MLILVVLIAGIAAVAAGVLIPSLETLVRVQFVALGTMLMLFSAVALVITRCYYRASANRAYVRTGAGGPRVILNEGALVIPSIHEIIPVSLETIRLNVVCHGRDALISKDNLSVDVKAEFYVKVEPTEEAILQAARSLGSRSLDPGAVSELVEEQLASALRVVAATLDVAELKSKRHELAAAVQQSVQSELSANGLTLESVTISSLHETDPANL